MVSLIDIVWVARVRNTRYCGGLARGIDVQLLLMDASIIDDTNAKLLDNSRLVQGSHVALKISGYDD